MAVKGKLALLLRSNRHGFVGVHPYVLEWPLLTARERLGGIIYLQRIFVAERVLLERVGAQASEVAESHGGLQKQKGNHF